MTNHEIQNNLSFSIIPGDVIKYLRVYKGVPKASKQELLNMAELTIEKVLNIRVSSCTIKKSYIKLQQLIYATAFYIAHSNKMGYSISEFEDPFEVESMVQMALDQEHLTGDLDTYSMFFPFYDYGEAEQEGGF